MGDLHLGHVDALLGEDLDLPWTGADGGIEWAMIGAPV